MATLTDVIRQLKLNQKSTDKTSDSVNGLAQIIKDQIQIDALARDAQRMQDIENQRELVNSLKSARGAGSPPTPPSGEPAGGKKVDVNLGLQALVVAAGAIVGAIRGHLKAIRTVANVIGDLLKGLREVVKGIGIVIADTWRFIKDMKLLPSALTTFVDTAIGVVRTAVGRVVTIMTSVTDFVSSKFASIYSAVGTKIETSKAFITGIFDNVVKWTDEAIATIRSMFSTDSAIGKVVASVKSSLDTFLEPIKAAATYLYSFIGATDSGPGFLKTIFEVIGGHIGQLGTIFKVASGVLEKIFWPLGVVMAAIDTIKGAIDGYAEGGIFGALQGAIDGLFASLIGEPLDLIKDITSWALSMLGFENASKWLDSFSFTELFDTITDKFFGGLGTVISFVGNLIGNMKDFLVSVFNVELVKIVNGFKIAFAGIGAFIANIGDQLYLMISKNLRFSLPEIKIPIPDWLGGGDFTLLSGFDVGVGDAATQAAAQGRIDTRNATRDTEIQKLNDDINTKMKEMADAWDKLKNTSSAPVVIVQDNSAKASTQNNSGAMVKLDASMSSSHLDWALRNGRLPQL